MIRLEDRKAQGRRLLTARLKLGLGTHEAAAEFLGVLPGTYGNHESGRRSISKVAKSYAEKLGVRLEWLMFGESELGSDVSSRQPTSASVNIEDDEKGALTRGVQKFNLIIINGPEGRGLWAEQTVKLPPGVPRVTATFGIKGAGLRPAYDAGNVLLFWSREEKPEQCVGSNCAVALTDETILLARLERGATPNTWTLMSVCQPLLLKAEAEIKWAAAIEVVLRSERWDAPVINPRPSHSQGDVAD